MVYSSPFQVFERYRLSEVNHNKNIFLHLVHSKGILGNVRQLFGKYSLSVSCLKTLLNAIAYEKKTEKVFI